MCLELLRLKVRRQKLIRQNRDWGNLPRTQRGDEQVWGVSGVLKLFTHALKLLKFMKGIGAMP
jgi:hypothetical protein